MRAFALSVVAFLVPACAEPGDARFHEHALEPALDEEELAFLNIINEYRMENGRGVLAPSPTLTDAADGHSFDMGERDFFDHTNLDGQNPSARCQEAGYPESCGENIFGGRQSAAEAFQWWRKSPGHNENMLRPEYGAIGIGRAFVDGSEWGWYWTNTFGGFVDLLPVTEEVCDGLDNDCDQVPDDGIDCSDVDGPDGGGDFDGGCAVGGRRGRPGSSGWLAGTMALAFLPRRPRRRR
jgi:uncharacterized protein YkwD